MYSHPANRPRGGIRIAIGAGLLVVSGLLFVRAAGPWPGDAIVWPAAVAALGALLIWRASGALPARRRGWAAHRPPETSQAVPSREPSARVRALGRPEVSRGGLGVTLVLAGGFAFLWANGALRPAGETVLAGLAVLIALALIFAPSWRRLARSLAAERTERIRSQERADVGAHLHDSVLQTLALIQRSAEDPKRVAALARRQERDLRGWLAEGDSRENNERLAGALAAAAAEVEATAGGTVEVVTVGDCSLDEPVGAVVGAAREAMLNAAKFAGQAPISVYAELSGERIQVFVRDHGAGFDPAAVPRARRGVRESIIGRMRRAGGSATVRALPGGGTEVEIAIDRGDRS
ncbi:MAG TPA: ATP-binding protein [Solirubrobacteraceae bacterium]|nr:ATP-binding protein [Solirubrobacteraceae bacterium]